MGVPIADWGLKVPARPPPGMCPTHGVDDALQSLEAVVHREHVVLTVRDPGQLRIQQTQTHTEMCQGGCGGRKQATVSGVPTCI